MALKKTIKKITTQVEDATKKADTKLEQASEETEEQKVPKRRGCSFCQSKQIPSYEDTATLKRFLSERTKILPKTYTHLCSKHQRAVTKHIKYARHLALLPFTPKI